MRIFVSDPPDTTVVNAMVIGVEGPEECVRVRAMIRGYSLPVHFYPGMRRATFVFERPTCSDRLYLVEEYPDGYYDHLRVSVKQPAPPSGSSQLFEITIGSTVYDELDEICETFFFNEGLDQELEMLPGKVEMPGTRCRHEPGSTPIFGHRICKFCGIDLD